MLLFMFDDTCDSQIFSIKPVAHRSVFQNRYHTASRPTMAVKTLKGLDHMSYVERLGELRLFRYWSRHNAGGPYLCI